MKHILFGLALGASFTLSAGEKVNLELEAAPKGRVNIEHVFGKSILSAGTSLRSALRGN
jgi:hypothetical protein